MDWCTIESDPGVFTELIEKFGVSNVIVDEVYGLDKELYGHLGHIHGLIFLFKYEKAPSSSSGELIQDHPTLFFANQMIQNACATQAILSILMNAENVDLGETLSEFKDFTLDLPADMRGVAISNSDTILEAHNSFARSNPFVIEQDPTSQEEGEAFHFAAFLPHQGGVYELDGLKAGPCFLGDIPSDSEDPLAWLDVVQSVLEERMASYANEEIRFALMAVSDRPSVTWRAELEQLGGNESEESLSRKVELEQRIQEEEDKLADWYRENERRRHNYFLFMNAIFRHLAGQNLLEPMVEKGRGRTKERREAAKKLKEQRAKK
jgi:ubiquitin carboxyl-terminal hydrolase L5